MGGDRMSNEIHVRRLSVLAAVVAVLAGCATAPDIASRTPPLTASFSTTPGAAPPVAAELVPEDAWPRADVVEVPRDLAALGSTAKRKRAFVDFMLPLVLGENERILEERARLLRLVDRVRRGAPAAAGEWAWLEALRVAYKAPPGDLAALVRRVDEVPPSLALAQAAEESGWGTSRFARTGNAVFGQRTWTRGAGMVPLRRADGEKYEVKVFAAPVDSVRAYMRNLNTHPAYAEFRAARRDMRVRGEPLDGYRLALALAGYSERRQAYVESIRAIIRVNRLSRFDGLARTVQADADD